MVFNFRFVVVLLKAKTNVAFLFWFVYSLPEKRGILRLKFCPTFALLSLQRCEIGIDFVIFKNAQPVDIFSYRIKNKTAKILDFFWTNVNEIVIVTNAGIEFIQVAPERKLTKILKTYSLTVTWFVYQVSVICLILYLCSIITSNLSMSLQCSWLPMVNFAMSSTLFCFK